MQILLMEKLINFKNKYNLFKYLLIMINIKSLTLYIKWNNYNPLNFTRSKD